MIFWQSPYLSDAASAWLQMVILLRLQCSFSKLKQFSYKLIILQSVNIFTENKKKLAPTLLRWCRPTMALWKTLHGIWGMSIYLVRLVMTTIYWYGIWGRPRRPNRFNPSSLIKVRWVYNFHTLSFPLPFIL